MQNRQDVVLPTCSLQLGERAYITTRCCKKAEICFENFRKKSHYEIRHYAMPYQRAE